MITKLTGKEQEVLNLLMLADSPMTSAEVAARDAGLNANTVNSVLRSLLKKGYIEVADIVYSGTVLCRCYRPSQKASENELRAFAAYFEKLKKAMPVPQIFAGLVDGAGEDGAVIEQIAALLAQKKAALSEEEQKEES